MNYKEEIQKLENQIAFLKVRLEKEESDYTWEKCFQEEGYYIDDISNVSEVKYLSILKVHKGVYRTEKEAKSALAMAQLSHIIYVANGCEELDWNDNYKEKYVLCRDVNEIDAACSFDEHYFLSFKTQEIRDKVLAQNERLIKDYLMID